MLTRDAILSASDLPKEKVEVPEWGGAVWVKTMTGAERDSFEQSIIDAKGSTVPTNVKGKVKAVPKPNFTNVRARLVVRAVVDEQGTRLFTDDDAEALGAKSGKALDRLFEVAQRLCGIGDKDVEALEGN
jgi:hypothetical protein